MNPQFYGLRRDMGQNCYHFKCDHITKIDKCSLKVTQDAILLDKSSEKLLVGEVSDLI